MRLCLVSDTHRHRHELLTAVKSVQPLDAILHAGDETSDVEWLASRVDWPVFAVAGNWDAPSPQYPLERVLTEFGPPLLLTHGHMLHVKEGLHGLAERAQAVGARIVVYGHTHIAMAAAENGLVFVNPGSLATPRGGRQRTFALLEVAERTADTAYEVRVTHLTATGEATHATLHVVLPPSG
ncbi:MAG: metallophosphoesterase [Alicyclobacillus sp.]|nr:metallophosphoesterase [Alicyclobacillus sp.]